MNTIQTTICISLTVLFIFYIMYIGWSENRDEKKFFAKFGKKGCPTCGGKGYEERHTELLIYKSPCEECFPYEDYNRACEVQRSPKRYLTDKNPEIRKIAKVLVSKNN